MKTVNDARATSRERLLLSIITSIVFGYQHSPAVAATKCQNVASIPNGDVISSHPAGATLTFTCDPGLQIRGSRKIICNSDGQWSDPPPHCTALECKREMSKVESGRKCRKSCTIDQDCSGSLKKCLCDDYCGKSCFNPAANCSTPTPPENGFIDYDGISYGYNVTYGCKVGFQLFGSSTRICRSDRKWSSHEPRCIATTMCGRVQEQDYMTKRSRVVAGTDAKTGAWPWQALIFYNSGNSVKQLYETSSVHGGGSIIHIHWVLTAAHNLNKRFSLFKENKDWSRFFLIAVGMTRFPEDEIPDYIQIYEPDKVYRHPQFNQYTFDYDVALIRVGRRLRRSGELFVPDVAPAHGNIQFSEYVGPVCLPCMTRYPYDTSNLWDDLDRGSCAKDWTTPSNVKPNNLVATVTGFGSTRAGSKGFMPSVLQQGVLKVLEGQQCNDSIKHLPDAIFTDRMICAKSADDKKFVDACEGDSGGPLVKQYGDSSFGTSWVEIGIVSWGYGCGNEIPGFYTKVSAVMGWIVDIATNKTAIQGNDACKSQPCLNDAICEETAGGFECQCNPGYSGKICEIKNDPCRSSPCFNNGICRSSDSDFKCHCKPGFSGNLCEASGVEHCRRNLTAASVSGRSKCTKQCNANKDCMPKKTCKRRDCHRRECICDRECGMSCVTTTKTCPKLKRSSHVQFIGYVERDRNTNCTKLAREPYYYGVEAHHFCDFGYEAEANNIRVCHGRGSQPWTNEIICAKYCPRRRPDLVAMYKLTCGSDCRVDKDCKAGMICTCDGSCGRTCANPDVDCGDALPAQNSDIVYRGEKLGKLAIYACKRGFYKKSGDTERRCTGSGIYEGITIKCRETRHNDSSSESPADVGLNFKSFVKEVYFVIDLSWIIEETSLQKKIAFAQTVVRRLIVTEATDPVGYGIVVFASRAIVKLNIAEAPKKTPSEVIEILEGVLTDVDNIRKKSVGYGLNIAKALELLDESMIAFSWEYNNKDYKAIKRQIFVLSDANIPEHTFWHGGSPPSIEIRTIEAMYYENPPEFYFVVSPNCPHYDIESSEENIFYVDDINRIDSYVDQVTGIKSDYSVCGKIEVPGKAYARRAITKGDIAERVWPWQALITQYKDNILAAFRDRSPAGGSLINKRWVLTSAATLRYMTVGGRPGLLVFLGTSRRPTTIKDIEGSTRIFQPEELILHNEHRILDPLDDDAALIKLGREYSMERDGRLILSEGDFSGMVDFSPYIRPVCLPCSSNTCISKMKNLVKNPSVGDHETSGEKCRIEQEYLMSEKEGHDPVLVTGFGHNSTLSVQPKESVMLQEFLKEVYVEIEERTTCQKAVRMMYDYTPRPVLTDKMFCATPKQPSFDACLGDGGGPAVRQVRDKDSKETCFVQVGIVSWGYGCGLHTYVYGKRFYYPSFYTNVASMIPWINKTMEEYGKAAKN